MKRLHLHVGVEKLDEAIAYYSALFGAEPVKVKADYAKWFLEDPSVNFAISTRAKVGLDHLGIHVDSEEELGEIRTRIDDAAMAKFDEGETTCCYAKADKTWTKDPAGIAWETYRTMGDANIYGLDRVEPADVSAETSACCVPNAITPDAVTEEAPKSACCG